MERARRIEREIAAEDDRKNFLNSSQGAQTANNEKVVLFHELERFSDKISASGGKLAFKKERNEREFILSTHEFSLRVVWLLYYSNTLKDSRLHIELWKNLLLVCGRPLITIPSREPKLLKEMEFDFDRNAAGELGWRRLNKEKRFFSSAQLAQECMKILLDEVRNIRLGV